MRTYVLEPQALFVPALSRALALAGATIVGQSARLERGQTFEDDVEAIFVDVDCAWHGPASVLCELRALAPATTIIAYGTCEGNARETDWLVAGADVIVPKALDESGFVEFLAQGLDDARSGLAASGSERR